MEALQRDLIAALRTQTSAVQALTEALTTVDPTAGSFAAAGPTSAEAVPATTFAAGVIAQLKAQPGARGFKPGRDNYYFDVKVEGGEFRVAKFNGDDRITGFGHVYFDYREERDNAIQNVGEDNIVRAVRELAGC